MVFNPLLEAVVYRYRRSGRQFMRATEQDLRLGDLEFATAPDAEQIAEPRTRYTFFSGEGTPLE